MDFSSCLVKLDHSVGTPDPLPNFRQVPGFPVYATGQPTLGGFSLLAEKIPKEKVLWFNLRQEPVVYINKEPCAPRQAATPHDNIVMAGVDNPTDLDQFETKFAKSIEGMKKDGSLEVHKDKDLQENPMDREDITDTMKPDTVQELHKVLAGLSQETIPGLTVVRAPFQEERGLPESCFDLIVSQLAGQSPSTTHCVFSSQAGRGRSTLGTVVASIVKAAQMIVKLGLMVEEGMAEKKWADGIIKTKFEDPLPSEDLKDPFLRGEFDVIKELLEKLPEAKEGKVLADKMIDINGVPPEGNGVQNLRKCIIQTKYKYDASTEDKQVVWKRMIINFIERYFYLICFATYCKSAAREGFKLSFVAWMDSHKELRTMIENGKDKLEWYRKVDDAKVSDLRSLISGDDYKKGLGDIISKLYKLALQTYVDMPRGPIRNNLMKKLVCKTLLEILPGAVSERVQQEILTNKLPMDFETVLGLVVA